MKIQSINNQSNISHKAYFKPNKEFKKIFGNNQMLSLEFKKRLANLPNHEIEVLEGVSCCVHSNSCTVFNNNTKCLLNVKIKENYRILETIIEAMERNTYNFFKNYFRIDDFEEITREPKVNKDPKFPV